MLARCANGFGGLALASLLTEQARGKTVNSLAPKQPHFTPKATRRGAARQRGELE